jgi:hypothetical protein
MAHQADGVVAVEVHPVERHEREKMADMQGRSRGVYANVCADALLGQEPVESLPSAVPWLEPSHITREARELTPQRP